MLESLTAVVLTFNEEERIERCLKSLLFVKSVVILDSYSKDKTLEKAAKVWLENGRNAAELVTVLSPWKGFVKARNLSLNWVQSPWVLWVDADEWVGEKLKLELIQVIGSSSADRAKNLAKIPRQSSFMGRAIRHGGWFPDRKTRLARSDSCVWVEGPNGSDVHEELTSKASVEKSPVVLKNFLFHEPFRNVEEQEETNDRYSTLLAQGLARRWKDQGRGAPSGIYIGLKCGVKFFENYFWKLGFLDGKAGLKIAIGSAKSLRMRLVKAGKFLNNL